MFIKHNVDEQTYDVYYDETDWDEAMESFKTEHEAKVFILSQIKMTSEFCRIEEGFANLLEDDIPIVLEYFNNKYKVAS